MGNNSTYVTFNAICVAAAYVMLGLSLWLAPVNIATKGYWAMGILLLTGSLVNLVKFRVDAHVQEQMSSKVERAKNEKLISEYVSRDV